jgi:hypothetical protein
MNIDAAGCDGTRDRRQLNPRVAIEDVETVVGIGDELGSHAGQPEVTGGSACNPEMDGAAPGDLEPDGLVGCEPFRNAGERQRAARVVGQVRQVRVIPRDPFAVHYGARGRVGSKIAVAGRAAEGRHVIADTRQTAGRPSGVVGEIGRYAWRRMLLFPDGPEAVDVAMMKEEHRIVG